METPPEKDPTAAAPVGASGGGGAARTTAAPPDAHQPSGPLPEAPGIERIQVAFPQLELIGLIGQGGMGVVYKARQPRLDRFVALKILRQSFPGDTGFAERFGREARAMARLNHPRILDVYDCGQSQGYCYLLVEFVEGVNLRQAMQAGRLDPQRAMAIASSVCEALQFAHDAGVVHRDIKPENILLDGSGRVKIADFGLARLIGELAPSPGITLGGVTMGTPQYMSPEQFQDPHEVDQRADIYAVGILLYEMLTGDLPVGVFPPPSQRSPVDARVDRVVLRALERDRDKRYGSAAELKASLDAIAAQGPVDAAVGAAPVRQAPSRAAAEIGSSGRPGRPLWWTVSAWLFLAIGLLATVDTLASLYARPVNPTISPGLAHLFAATAMLTLSRRWRVVALFALGIALTGTALIILMTAIAPEHAAVTVPGAASHNAALERPRWAAAAAVAVSILLVWPVCVLLSPTARSLFRTESPKGAETGPQRSP